MTHIIDRYNAITGGFIAVFSYLFGRNWGLFGVFLLFNIGDWITGWIKSRIAGKENSVKGWTGVLKKLGYWLMILTAFLAGRWFIAIGDVLGFDLHITTLIGWFVLASLTVNEIRSILENFVEAGFEVPTILVKGLEVADKSIKKINDGKKADSCIGCENLSEHSDGSVECIKNWEGACIPNGYIMWQKAEET